MIKFNLTDLFYRNGNDSVQYQCRTVDLATKIMSNVIIYFKKQCLIIYNYANRFGRMGIGCSCSYYINITQETTSLACRCLNACLLQTTLKFLRADGNNGV